ncbi:hypothetical protein PQX77_005520 [Marasmius sp. AFHP31]|nr:hypothetical protein PQX77_005520 [Marasmius sp. AFHP31]
MEELELKEEEREKTQIEAGRISWMSATASSPVAKTTRRGTFSHLSQTSVEHETPKLPLKPIESNGGISKPRPEELEKCIEGALLRSKLKGNLLTEHASVLASEK